MKYLLYLAMSAVIIFFLGFYIVNKKATELQKETAVPRSRVAENKNSDTSIKKNSTPKSDQKEKQHLHKTEQNVTELQELTEVKAFDEAIENNVPDRLPTIHPDENLDEIGLAATNSFGNYNQIDELRYSMQDDGIAEEDIENMLGSPEESNRSGYIFEQSATSPEELEDEIVTSFIDAEVPSEDMEVMLKDLMNLHGIETSDSSDKPVDPPLPDAEQNEGIDNQ